jgi:hypothetical protein
MSGNAQNMTQVKIMETILSLALVISLPLLVYVLFLRPRILAWGASDDEAKMPLIGDALAPFISATRAISIDAPVAEVWKWVTQLGADRGGFFSYAFLEKVLGYEMREPELVTEFQGMDVGRIIPASLDESKSVIKYSFPVLAVEPGKAFVLKEWGAFVLNEVGPTHTRLIVRTHGQECPNLLRKVDRFVGEPLHYIMERRMLMGFKAQAETGMRLPSTADNAWLLGIILSGIGIALLALMGGGVQAMVLSVIYGIIWLWTLLIYNPRSMFSLILFVVIAVTIAWVS